jgi:hypothetical protein
LWTEANVANAIIGIMIFAQPSPAKNPPLIVRLVHWLTVNQDIWDDVKPPALPRVIELHPALAGGSGVVQIEIDRAMTLDEVGWKMLGLPKSSRAKIRLTMCKFLLCARAHSRFQHIRGLLPDTHWIIDDQDRVRHAADNTPHTFPGDTEVGDCTMINWGRGVGNARHIFMLFSHEANLMEPLDGLSSLCENYEGDVSVLVATIRARFACRDCLRGYPFRRLHYLCRMIGNYLDDWCDVVDTVFASLPLSIREIRHAAFFPQVVESRECHQTSCAVVDSPLLSPCTYITPPPQLTDDVFIEIIGMISVISGRVGISDPSSMSLWPVTYLCMMALNCLYPRMVDAERAILRPERTPHEEKIAGQASGILLTHGRTPGLPAPLRVALRLIRPGAPFARGLWSILKNASPSLTSIRLVRVLTGMRLPRVGNTEAFEQFLESLSYIGPRGQLQELLRGFIRTIQLQIESEREELKLLMHWFGGGGIPIGCAWIYPPTVAFCADGICVDTDRAIFYLTNPMPRRPLETYPQISVFKAPLYANKS